MPDMSTSKSGDQRDAGTAEDDDGEGVADQDADAPPPRRWAEHQRDRDQQADHERQEEPGTVVAVGEEDQADQPARRGVDAPEDRPDKDLHPVALARWRRGGRPRWLRRW